MMAKHKKWRKLRGLWVPPGMKSVHPLQRVPLTSQSTFPRWHNQPAVKDQDVVHAKVNQEIIAWRAWNVDDKGYLHSITANCRWEGPVLDNKIPPVIERQDGTLWGVLWGSDGPADPTLGIHATKVRGRWQGMVYGTVALSGTVIEGEDGYRAQRATIRSLVVTRATAHHNMFDLQEMLAERYQCDVTVEPADPEQDVTPIDFSVAPSYAPIPVAIMDTGPQVAGYSRHSQELWAA